MYNIWDELILKYKKWNKWIKILYWNDEVIIIYSRDILLIQQYHSIVSKSFKIFFILCT